MTKMVAAFIRKLSIWNLYRNAPTEAMVSDAIKMSGAHGWYLYAFTHFYSRQHAYLCYRWICKNIEKKSKILEVACGTGGCLIFLHARKYEKLFGYDFDTKSIDAATSISKMINGSIEYFVCDARKPTLHETFKVIIWINGMYHLTNFSLKEFLESHIPFLDEDGYFIFDMVDDSFNQTKNNEYSTQDWDKPVSERRESEYILRMSSQEIRDEAEMHDLEVVMLKKIQGEIPRDLVVLRKRVGDDRK